MGRLSSKVLKECYSQECQTEYKSPIPPHLTPEERAEWEKELKWEKQELARRKKEGFWKYSNQK